MSDEEKKIDNVDNVADEENTASDADIEKIEEGIVPGLRDTDLSKEDRKSTRLNSSH